MSGFCPAICYVVTFFFEMTWIGRDQSIKMISYRVDSILLVDGSYSKGITEKEKDNAAARRW